jgi:protein O-GlcNAc transferase
VQVSWLGYFDTTGLAEVDVRIADEHALPQASERWFTERVVHLPRSSNCFLPPPGAPKVAAAPCTQNGYVTFGLYNQAGKLNRAFMEQVAAILRAVPRSRLVFKHASFGDELVCERVRRLLARERIDAKRLSFRGKSSLHGYLAAFSEIDVALDPFPYGGETSALHALWMGVPVIALEGDTLATRLGSRVLRVAGLDAWVTRTPEDYVARAVAAAGDAEALAAVRKELRAVLRGSPLLDHVGVTRELENAYRDAWRAHERARGL